MKSWLYAGLAIIAIAEANNSQAQSPGGVSTGLKLWVESATGVATTTSNVDSWQYINDVSKSFSSGGAERPVLVTSELNFKPVLRFSAGQVMTGPTGINAPVLAGDDDYTVLAVWKSTSISAFQRVWFQGSAGVSNDAASLATWNDGTYGDETGTSPFQHTINRNYSSGEWNITQLNLKNQALGDLEIIDNRNISGTITTLNTDPSAVDGATLRNISDQLNNIGAKQFGTQQPLIGDIAEILIFDRSVSGTERNRIFSYLALKYGISTKTNLISSASTTVWDASANSTYNNSVFGIGLDNASGLSISQSNSVDNGSGNGTGQSGKGNILISSSSTLTNGDFLIIGNELGALTVGTSEIPVTAAGSSRLAREWKVQKTGTGGTITLLMDFNGITGVGTTASDFRLMVDEDGNGNFQTGTIRYYTPSSYSSVTGRATFTAVTLNNGEIFSFITNASAVLPVTWKSFTASPVNGNIKLNWKVENNENAKLYEITHSLDGVNFSKIAEINNSASIKSYDYTYLPSASGKHYFRILQSDFDGKSIYSKIVSADIQSADYSVRLLNNPLINNFAELEVKAAKSTNVIIEVWSVAGSKIMSRQQLIGSGTSKLQVNIGTAGNYILKVKVGNITLNEQIIKL